MKATELRIGNWIIHDKNEIQVTANLINGMDNWQKLEDEKNISSPIPLTEKWLLKFGAIMDENRDLYIQHPEDEQLRFYLVEGFIQLTKKYYCPISNYKHIQYIHQLQNLYFALTGKELKYE